VEAAALFSPLFLPFLHGMIAATVLVRASSVLGWPDPALGWLDLVHGTAFATLPLASMVPAWAIGSSTLVVGSSVLIGWGRHPQRWWAISLGGGW
jgi:hypothetical protein